MTYVGEIVHELPHRIRIKVSAAPGDGAFFDRLVRDVAAAPNIVEVRANARAGCLTVCGDGANGPLRATLEQSGLFEFRTPPPVVEPKRRGIDPDAALAIVMSGLGLAQLVRGRATGGASENFWNAYRSQAHLKNRAATLALAALGLIQLGRGRYLNSASSLFYYALTARQLLRERAPPGSRRPQ